MLDIWTCLQNNELWMKFAKLKHGLSQTNKIKENYWRTIISSRTPTQLPIFFVIICLMVSCVKSIYGVCWRVSKSFSDFHNYVIQHMSINVSRKLLICFWNRLGVKSVFVNCFTSFNDIQNGPIFWRKFVQIQIHTNIYVHIC